MIKATDVAISESNLRKLMRRAEDNIRITLGKGNTYPLSVHELQDAVDNEVNSILQLDFYDFCGIDAIGMTNEMKIKWYCDNMIADKQ